MTGKPESIIDQYERNARRWDSERSKNLFEKEWLDAFLSLLPSSPSVLELGVGSGDPITRYMIDNGAEVTGLDSSSEMIEMCGERFPEHQWLVGDMRTLSMPETFDGIIAWNSFFHLTAADQRNMFSIFGSHLAHGGALMFTSGPEAGERIGNLCGEPLFHASLDSDEYKQLLSDNELEVVRQINEDPNCNFHTIWLAQKTAASV